MFMGLYNRSKFVLFRRVNIYTLTHVQFKTGSHERMTEMLLKTTWYSLPFSCLKLSKSRDLDVIWIICRKTPKKERVTELTLIEQKQIILFILYTFPSASSGSLSFHKIPAVWWVLNKELKVKLMGQDKDRNVFCIVLLQWRTEDPLNALLPWEGS